MKLFKLVPLLVAALLAGCTEATGPVPDMEMPSIEDAKVGQDGGFVVPDDGKIYRLSESVRVPKGPMSNLKLYPLGPGNWGMSCTTVFASRRCTLLWLGATGTTTVAIATCASGVFTAACGGAVLAVGYTWDQYFSNPDCSTCNRPYNQTMGDQWMRYDEWGNPR